MSKKYYWLKLKEDFFDRDEIKIVENMQNGKDYIIFFLKLQLKSINSNGLLLFKNTIPYSDEMLATVTSTNIDVVRSAVKVFMQLEMIERLDDGTLFMTEVQKLIGTESESAERVRKHREKNKQALLCNGQVTEDNVQSNLDIRDKDIRYEENRDKDIKDKDIIIIMTEHQEKFINELKKIKNYPFDLQKDFDMYNRLAEKYPALDLLEAINDWAAYKLDKPIRDKDNPRSQINTSCKKYMDWGKCLKKEVKSDGVSNEDNNTSRFGF